jgi:hypothetical protein
LWRHQGVGRRPDWLLGKRTGTSTSSERAAQGEWCVLRFCQRALQAWYAGGALVVIRGFEFEERFEKVGFPSGQRDQTVNLTA